jgi:hypothetical protein
VVGLLVGSDARDEKGCPLVVVEHVRTLLTAASSRHPGAEGHEFGLLGMKRPDRSGAGDVLVDVAAVTRALASSRSACCRSQSALAWVGVRT